MVVERIFEKQLPNGETMRCASLRSSSGGREFIIPIGPENEAFPVTVGNKLKLLHQAGIPTRLEARG